MPVAIAWLAAALAAAAAPTVSEVEVRDEAGVADATSVRAYVATAVGSEFDPARVRADVRRLLDTGRFASVDASLVETKDGVRVVFAVRSLPRLAERIEVSGARHLNAERVRELLGLQVGDRVSEDIVKARACKVMDEYREDGYADTDVQVVVVQQGTGAARVTLRMNEGRRVWVRGVRFPGATAFGHEELDRILGQRAWWNPMRWVRRRVYEPADLDAGLLGVRARYMDAGFRDVRVGPMQIATNRNGSLDVAVPVREGVRFRVDGVTLQGATLFPETDLLRQVGLRTGDWAGDSAIGAAAQSVRDYYGARGYVDTEVRPLITCDSGSGLARVRLFVEESGLTMIRNIRIRGNAATRDKVIRRELLVHPGEILDEVKARRSETRIQNLGFFGSARHYTEELPTVGRPPVREGRGDTSAVTERDLVYEVEEKRAGQFMVGAGFSSIDRMSLFMDIQHGNFDIGRWPPVGGGQKLNLHAQLGNIRRDVSVSFVEPWFLDRKLQFGVEVYHSSVEYDDYDLKRVGGALSLTKGLFYGFRGTVQYRFERESITDVDDTNTYVYTDSPEETYSFALEEDRTASSLRFTLSRDSRNNPFIPSSGSFVQTYAQLTGGPLGGETDLYQVGIRLAHHLSPWWRHVVGMRLQYDTIDAYGTMDDVPLGSRLFAGGGRTIRGFSYRDVGPKVVLAEADGTLNYGSYRSVGGQSRCVANVEYTIPLGPLFRLAAFCDAGDVWRDAFDFDGGSLAVGGGVGLRFDVPGFPIRIDRAWALHKDDPFTEEEIVVFWIGYDN
jgi:outer membrane protein insertion porin family